MYNNMKAINETSAVSRDKIKKIKLTLTRRAKVYSSSYSQTVSLSPNISSQFILGVCAAANDRKNKKPLFWKFRVFQSRR